MSIGGTAPTHRPPGFCAVETICTAVDGAWRCEGRGAGRALGRAECGGDVHGGLRRAQLAGCERWELGGSVRRGRRHVERGIGIHCWVVGRVAERRLC